MIRIVPGFSPEISRRDYEIMDNIEKMLNDNISSVGILNGGKIIVVNPIIINPIRGVIQNGIKLMNRRKELWITFNVNYNDYLISCDVEKVSLVLLSFKENICSADEKILPLEFKCLIIASINSILSAKN